MRTVSIRAARKAGVVAAVGLLLLLPVLLPRFYAALGVEILIMSLFAVSFNLLFGYAGMLSFGQAGFFGIGAYTTALVLKNVISSLTVAMAAGALMAFLAAVAIGFVCVRFTKTYFIMLTVAFGELLAIIGQKWVSLTGGDDGLVGIPVPTIALPGLPVFDLADLRVYYCFTLIVVVAAVGTLWLIVESHFGYVLRSIRDNRERAEFLGLNVRRHLLACYALAGLFTGLAGALRVPFEGMVSLETLHFAQSANPIIMSILGGTRFFLGPVVGSILFILAKDTIQNVTEFWMLWIGVFFIGIVMFLAKGVMGFLEFVSGKFRALTPSPAEKP